jgi:hypothetical protein
MFSGLDNDDIVDGLRELIARANSAGLRGTSVQIIGGAALKLAYFDRAITVDIDARDEAAGVRAPWASRPG